MKKLQGVENFFLLQEVVFEGWNVVRSCILYFVLWNNIHFTYLNINFNNLIFEYIYFTDFHQKGWFSHPINKKRTSNADLKGRRSLIIKFPKFRSFLTKLRGNTQFTASTTGLLDKINQFQVYVNYISI